MTVPGADRPGPLSHLRVLDLSQHGASVELPDDVELPVDAQVNAALFLHRGKPLGVVVRCAFTQIGDEGSRLYGLHFLGTPSVTRMALDRFVAAAEALQTQPSTPDPIGDVDSLEAALD